jgi:type III secretory pathway component EscS
MPIGIIITFWVLLNKVQDSSFQYYLILAAVWTVIAVVFDYLFIEDFEQLIDRNI